MLTTDPTRANLTALHTSNASAETDRRWYFEAHDQIAERAEQLGVDARMLAGIVAATSPNNSWDTVTGKYPNLDCACKFVSTGANVHVGPVMTKVRAIAAGADPLSVLRGPKERSFYSNLADPETSDAVTCDRWIARAVGKSNDSFTPRQYAVTEQMFRDAADQLGIRAHELQASVWAAIRRDPDIVH